MGRTVYLPYGHFAMHHHEKKENPYQRDRERVVRRIHGRF